MSDMLKVIEPKSDQINAEDMLGRDMTITVTGVTVRAGTEQPVAITFAGSDKLFRPCKTVSRCLVAGWGPDTSAYIGRSLTLYRDENVKWAGMAVGGIRVRAMSDIDGPLKLALAESKKNRSITTIQPLVMRAPVEAFTIEAAELALRLAKTLDELKAEWVKKPMAPYRQQLQPVLDERKVELTPANTDAADIAKLYADATTPEDIEAADMAANKLGLSEDLTVQAARSDARDAIGGEA